MTAKEGETYADIIKKMKKDVNPTNQETKILAIRRTQKRDILIVLENNGDVTSLNEALEKAVGTQAKVSTLIFKRLVEIKDIVETITVEDVLEVVGEKTGIQTEQIAGTHVTNVGKQDMLLKTAKGKCNVLYVMEKIRTKTRRY